MKRLRGQEAVGERQAPEPQPEHVTHEDEGTAYRRDRLLAALTLISGAGLVLALPFALRAGAEFFLPVTAALVIAIALVPLLEWFERRRVPSGLAALICVLLFIAIANIAVASIVLPRANGCGCCPSASPDQGERSSRLLDVYASLEQFIDDIVKRVSEATRRARAR
jgi:predicted PurR-regulated permease PerM